MYHWSIWKRHGDPEAPIRRAPARAPVAKRRATVVRTVRLPLEVDVRCQHAAAVAGCTGISDWLRDVVTRAVTG